MTYIRTMIHIYRESRLNRLGRSVSLASLANNISSNLGSVLSVFFCHYFSIFDGHFSIFYVEHHFIMNITDQSKHKAISE